jgi:hypothetical protein
VFDTNKDDFISKLEFVSVNYSSFTMFEKDGDGRFSRTEYESGFFLFDIDGDDKISKPEFQIVGGFGFVFDMLDTDDDGNIAQKEYNTVFEILDLDHDDFLTGGKIGVASKTYFDLFDVDKDGKLSLTENKEGVLRSWILTVTV